MESKETVLVTGGTGFVGMHTILQLLQRGYKVKTTVRNLSRKGEVLEMLKNGGVTFSDSYGEDHLEFVEADLTKDENWAEAVEGKEIFNEAPNRWLIQKRLQEAHFLMDKESKKPSEIYIDLGFEDLSHFSFVFKKQFGYAPGEIAKQKMR